jgi:hypothetical protein
MTEKIGYKLNPVKLTGASQSILPFVCGAFYYTEDYEYFNIIKPYLDIPKKPKTLEEISQELEEKIDKRIERVKEQFNKLGYTQEYQYQVKFNRIFENFEYAKEHGQFPQKSILTYSTPLGVNGIASSFIIKQGNKHEGYYTIGNGYLRFYMPTKPNAITRWFMKNCLSFVWVDEKND